MEQQNHISFTQLNMYLRCGEQYYRRYVKGEKLPPSGNMVRGRSCHRAEEINYKHKIETSSDITISEVQDLFSDEWERGKFEIVWRPDELDGASPKLVEAKFKDSGIGLITAYHKEIAPFAHPTNVEQEFTVQFQFEGAFTALPLYGIIDRIDNDVVIDAKFQSRSPSDNDAQKDIQLVAYQLGYENLKGQKPRKLRKEYSIATKVAKTKIQEIDAHGPERIYRLLFVIERVMEAISKGIFLPATLGHWCCDPRFCGYFDTCKLRQG